MEELDIRERGGMRNGEPQFLDRRLFMQLLAFGGARDTGKLIGAMDAAHIPGVLYEDVNDPQGIAVLTWSDDPSFFLSCTRRLLNSPEFAGLTQKLEYSMLGRTYSIGHEPNLESWLIERSARSVTDPEFPWAVWYPLRRKSEFAALPMEEQRPILQEHGRIGHAFGDAGYAHDVRLACHGIDKNDNDFVIGLIGKELYPLSKCVEAMRKTKQTSRYMEHMGPFFVGKAVWQNQG
jgi:chlorite dismutase